MDKLRASTNQVSAWLVLLFYSCFLASSCSTTALGQTSPISANEGLPSVRWSDAEKVVGSVALVSGKIVNVGSFGKVNFLNFDSRRRDVFKVVIFRDHLEKFPRPLKELYDQKLVTVRGEVTLYKGVPQIQVSSFEQLKVVDRLPATQLPTRRTRTLGKQIRVASFNIRNLFDDVDDPYHRDETTEAKPRDELERLAATIRKVDADVLGMQEVESRGYLQRFVDVFLSDMGYEVVHYSGNDRRGSGLAMLTRVPVGSVTSHRHRRFPDQEGVMRRFSRDLLCVELLPSSGSPFEVWVVHLKSKRGGPAETEPQRMAEVGEIRRQLDRRLVKDPSSRIIIVGDFNDTKDSNPLRRLVGSGAGKLETFWDSIPSGTVTYTLDPYRELIDHVLCTPAAVQRYVRGSHRVESMTLKTSGSDHNPIMADFIFD